MANRRNDLETRLVATDDASKVIGKVADELDALEKRETEVPVGVDDKASAEIRTITDRLEGLSDEDKLIVLKASAGQAQREVDRILRSLSRVDQMDDKEVQIRIEALDAAKADLDRVQDEMRELDGKTATVDVEARGLDDMMGKLGELPGLLGEVATAIGPGGAIAGGIGALAAGAAEVATGFAEAGTEVRTMTQLTGASAEEASRLQAVWKTTGADVNDLNDVILQMIGVLQSSPELAAQLGINLDDGRNGVQRFIQVMDKLNGFIGSASDKAVLMSQLLGEEGARQGAKLLAVVDDISGAMADVSEGQVFTDEELAKAEELRKQSAETAAAWESVKNDLGEIVAGPMADLLSMVTSTLGGLNALVSGEAFNPKFWEGAAKGGQDLLGISGTHLENLRRQAEAGKDVNDEFERSFVLATQAAEATEAGADAAERNADAAREAIAAGREQAGLAQKSADLAEENVARQGLAVSNLQAYANVQGEVLDQQREMADAIAQMIKGLAAYDKAVKSVDWRSADIEGAITGMEEFRDAHFGLAEIAQNSAEAEKALGEAVKENGRNFDLGTEAGRKNLDAIRGLAEQIDVKLAAAYDKANGHQRRFEQSAAEIADTTLARLAEQMGLSEEQTAELATALGLMPEDIKTRYELSGEEEALTKIGLLQTAIDELPANVNTKVTQLIIKGDYVGALDEIQDYYDQHPATVKVVPTVSRGPTSDPIFGGPTTSGFGRSAGLVGAPAATSTVATVPLRVSVVKTQTPVVQNISLNAAVIGDPFDVTRAVEGAMRRAARLMPVRP